MRHNNEVLSLASTIKYLVLDVDGVLTQGGIIFDDSGREIKIFNVRDGHGIKMLQHAGIGVGIITGRHSEVVSLRAKELQIEHIFQNSSNKAEDYERIKTITGLRDKEIACIGDDINDLPLMKRVGLPIAVKDAEEELKRHALYITSREGGKGAVREACELILKAQGKWQRIIDAYLQV